VVDFHSFGETALVDGAQLAVPRPGQRRPPDGRLARPL